MFCLWYVIIFHEEWTLHSHTNALDKQIFSLSEQNAGSPTENERLQETLEDLFKAFEKQQRLFSGEYYKAELNFGISLYIIIKRW